MPTVSADNNHFFNARLGCNWSISYLTAQGKTVHICSPFNKLLANFNFFGNIRNKLFTF